jgi:hypothetical protein
MRRDIDFNIVSQQLDNGCLWQYSVRTNYAEVFDWIFNTCVFTKTFSHAPEFFDSHNMARIPLLLSDKTFATGK